MADFLKASEVLQIAVRIEENGEVFYRAMASKFKEKQIQEMFGFLADEDGRHRRIFEEMLSKTETYEPAESYAGEHVAYLRTVADDHIFSKEKSGELMARKIETSEEAITFGIQIELDSILYYLEIKDLVVDYQRQIIDKIIAEEHNHYLTLSGMLKILRKGSA